MAICGRRLRVAFMKANEIQEEAAETARTLKEKAMEWQQTAKDNATQWAQNTDAYVRDNPWTAIGITAFVAFTLGALVAVRRK